MLAVRSINPADVLTIGCMLQISRLFGGEIGAAFLRMREQLHSNLIGLHVDGLSSVTAERLAAYPGVLGSRTADAASLVAQAGKLLGTAVMQQASVLSYIDGFLAAGFGAFLCLVPVALMRPCPNAPF